MSHRLGADFLRVETPAQVNLSHRIRSTGTINIIMPETDLGVTVELVSWDVIAQLSHTEELAWTLAQEGIEHRIADFDFGHYSFFDSDINGPGDTGTIVTSTDTDSSRIIGQIQEPYTPRGIMPGEAEWRLYIEGPHGELEDLLGTAPVTLTSSVPFPKDVQVVNVTPTSPEPGRVAGTFTVANPISAGVAADVAIEARDAATGEVFAQEMTSVSAPGVAEINGANESDFNLPTFDVPDGIETVEVCAEVTGVAV